MPKRTVGFFLVGQKTRKTVNNGDRLQKLKEWQEKRNALKAQEKEKKIKPFYAGSGGIGPVSKPAPSITTVTSKPVTRLQLKNATNKFSTVQNQQKQTKPVTQTQGNV